MRLAYLFVAAALVGAAACDGPNGVQFEPTGGAGGGGTSSSSSGGAALTCAEVDEGVGCCDASGAVRFCTSTSTSAETLACGSGKVCGWNADKSFYDCVAFPGGAEPGGKYPLLCSAVTGSSSSSTSSSSSSSTSSSSTSASSSGTPAVTWTQIYNGVFGPSGSSSCVKGGGCHTFAQSGFKCGTSKDTCYNGIVASGYVNPGAGAASSDLVNPSSSPLCGSLGGNMPKGGGCVSAAHLADIKSWLSAGAPND
jgi:hypothetical protein